MGSYTPCAIAMIYWGGGGGGGAVGDRHQLYSHDVEKL